jgi:hypothetical protein
MQVSQNGTRMLGVVVVGYRRQRRIFTDPAHAAVYAEALPIIRKQLKAQRNALRKAAPKPPKPAKQPKVEVETPAKAPKAKTAPNNPKKPAWSKEQQPSVKFARPQAGINVPKYTGPKFDKNAPAINEGQIKPTVCPGHPGYDARFSLPPGTVVRGEFSSIPLGGTLA